MKKLWKVATTVLAMVFICGIGLILWNMQITPSNCYAVSVDITIPPLPQTYRLWEFSFLPTLHSE